MYELLSTIEIMAIAVVFNKLDTQLVCISLNSINVLLLSIIVY